MKASTPEERRKIQYQITLKRVRELAQDLNFEATVLMVGFVQYQQRKPFSGTDSDRMNQAADRITELQNILVRMK